MNDAEHSDFGDEYDWKPLNRLPPPSRQSRKRLPPPSRDLGPLEHVVWESSGSTSNSQAKSSISAGEKSDSSNGSRGSHSRLVRGLGSNRVLTKATADRRALLSGRTGSSGLHTRVASQAQQPAVVRTSSSESLDSRGSSVSSSDIAQVQAATVEGIAAGRQAWFTKTREQASRAGIASKVHQFPTLGSVEHYEGKCRPCRYFRVKEDCKNGYACSFCHLPHDSLSWSKLPPPVRKTIRKLVVQYQAAETEEERQEVKKLLDAVVNGEARVSHYVDVLLKAFREGKITQLTRGMGAKSKLAAESAALEAASADRPASSETAPIVELTRISL